MLTNRIGNRVVVLAALAHAFAAPAPSMSQERGDENGAVFSIRDVRLDEQDRLHASLRGADGSVRPLRLIEVREVHGKMTAQATTDARGDAAVTLSQGGIYLIVADEVGQLCRVWTKDAAPPGATDGVLLIEDATVMRGYRGPGKGVYKFLQRHPLATLGIGAAAVAVPVLLLEDNDSAS